MPIINAGSQIVNNGTKDNSGTVVYPQDTPIPQHLPLSFFFGEKGTTDRFLSSSAEALKMYGDKTFTFGSKYFNHATEMMNNIAGEGNTILRKRLIPTDAGPRSNVRIYIDVLSTKVPNYKRNHDGGIVYDLDENPVLDDVSPEIDGYKIRFVKETSSSEVTVGQLLSKAGTMTDGVNTSTMYPFIEGVAKYIGESYNNCGFIVESMINKDLNTGILNAIKALTYKLRLVKRADIKSSATIVKTTAGSDYSLFAFNDGINPYTRKALSIENSMATYENLDNKKYELVYPDFEDLYIYKEVIDTLLDMFIDSEKEYVSNAPKTWNDGLLSDTLDWFDFTTDDSVEIEDEKYLINFLTGKSSKNVNYFTIQLDKTNTGLNSNQASVTLSASTPIWLESGSDGSLTNEMFETLVSLELDKYLDPNSEVMDTAINVESDFYDSGFSLSVKEKIFNFVAVRKDTFCNLTTFVAENNSEVTLEDEMAIAAVLMARAKLMPDSEYFGTPAFRGIIVGGSGKLNLSVNTKRNSQLWQVAKKAARYMGAGNSEWKSGYSFSSENIIEDMYDLKPEFIPANIKPVLWDANIIWSQPNDRKLFFFPAMQTIYSNDTSVLNSYFTSRAICTLQKIADKTWRKFSGEDRLTNDQFAEAVVKFYNNEIKNKFDNRFVIVPKVEFTDDDLERGYSYNLIVEIYANVMKTVQTTAIFAYRQ